MGELNEPQDEPGKEILSKKESKNSLDGLLKKPRKAAVDVDELSGMVEEFEKKERGIGPRLVLGRGLGVGLKTDLDQDSETDQQEILWGGVGISKEAAKPERQLSPQEQEVAGFIESHKQSVSEALVPLIKENRFVLVGEAHLGECEPVRREVVLSLVKLKQAGLTHVALEANSANQGIIDELDFSDPKIKDILKEKRVGGVGWGDGNLDVLIMAKRLRLKVVLIDYDDGRKDSKRDNAQWQNMRDERMIAAINNQTDSESKVLIFIGSAHVHYKEVESYTDGKVKRLGARLVEKYGKEAVKSVRYVNSTGRFDGLPGFMSKMPSPQEISRGKNEVVIIPDQGPVKGDERVSAADYIITVV